MITYHGLYPFEPQVSGFRVCLRGGRANNGAQCGLSTLNVNNAVSSANANWGSPLSLALAGSCLPPSKRIRKDRPRPKAEDTQVKSMLVDESGKIPVEGRDDRQSRQTDKTPMFNTAKRTPK